MAFSHHAWSPYSSGVSPSFRTSSERLNSVKNNNETPLENDSKTIRFTVFSFPLLSPKTEITSFYQFRSRIYPRAQQNLFCFYPFMIQYIKRQHDNSFYHFFVPASVAENGLPLIHGMWQAQAECAP